MLFDELDNYKMPQIKDLYKTLFLKGKGLRSHITKQVASFLNIPTKQKQKLGRIIEYIHHSSILHDDVIDKSPIRRGELSAWMQFSMKKSILAGDYLFAEVALETASMNNLALMRLTAQTLKKLVMGEWKQHSAKNSYSIEVINTIHKLKTASLFQWCLKAPFLVTGHLSNTLHQPLDRIGNFMGIVFQRADDLLDFNIRNYENKITFKDLSEGYTNSFAAYLSKNKNKKFISNLKTCQSLKDVEQCVGGSLALKHALEKFDTMNTKWIEKCSLELDKLGKILAWQFQQDSIELLQELKSLAYKLYWRKSV